MGQEDPLEKGMATHSSILAWKIPWTEEHGGLPSMMFQHSDDPCDCTSYLLSISSVCGEGGTAKSAKAPRELVSSPFHHQEKSFHSEWVAGHWSHLAQRPKVPSLLSEGTPPPSTLRSSEGRLRPLTPLHIVARLPHHWLPLPLC